MAFPVSPTEGQTFTENNTVWIYSAVTGQWNRSVINPLNETLYVFGSASATGAAGEIQYTDGSRLAASPNLVWDDVNDELEVGGDVVLDDGGSFTTTLQTVTPTQNRTISFPDATGTVGLVAGSSGQVVYNASGAYAGVSTMTFDGTSVTLAGRLINSYTSLASSPAKVFTGTWFTGGTSTTTKPHLLIEPAGATSTAWSTSGTGLGVNAASGFTGRLLDLQLNGTSNFNVDSTGRVSFPLGAVGTPSLYPGADTNTGFWSPAADTIAASTGGSERARIDSSGRLLVGTSSARDTLSFSSIAPQIQLAGSTTSVSSILVHKFGNDADPCKVILLKNRGANAGSNGGLSVNDPLGVISFEATDGFGGSTLIGAEIGAYAESGHGSANDDGPARLVFSTTADGAASPTERMRITSAGVLQVADAGNITVGTTTGTKIGTATTQKLGFYNKTPVVQPTAVADATDAATAITQLNALLSRMRDLGLIAT
jgi:hypothetical protein